MLDHSTRKVPCHTFEQKIKYNLYIKCNAVYKCSRYFMHSFNIFPIARSVLF